MASRRPSPRVCPRAASLHAPLGRAHANGVDKFVANSQYVARRIRKTYGRESSVLHRPWTSTRSRQRSQAELLHRRARMVRKNARPDRRGLRAHAGTSIVVVGDGPLAALCRRKAGPTPSFAASCRRRVAATNGECASAGLRGGGRFRITVAESLACATPVIFYNRGGATEIVEDGTTGFSSTSKRQRASSPRWTASNVPNISSTAPHARQRRTFPSP